LVLTVLRKIIIKILLISLSMLLAQEEDWGVSGLVVAALEA